jgi:uncharacterized protein (TIGR02611 family)
VTDQQQSGLKDRLSRWREGVRERPAVNLAYRIGVGVLGVLVLGAGILAIPYPGPGWAIVFLGLGILATEFTWAQRVLKWVRRRYDAVMDWFKRQGLWVQVLGAMFTAAVVVVSLWLFGALHFAGNLVGLEWSWLESPLGIGS